MAMNRAQQRRLRQWLVVAAIVAVLAAMMAVNFIHHDPERAAVADLSARILQAEGGMRDATPAEREQVRQEFDRLSPAARDEVFRAVAHQRLTDLRKDLAGLQPSERAHKVQAAIDDMRRHREQLTPEERDQARTRLNSSDGQKMVKRMLDFYSQELTATERAELDPLVHEWLNQVNELAH